MAYAADTPLAIVAAPSRTSSRRGEMIAAALCFAQFSEPLFAAVAQSQGATEPPAYARLLFLPVYAFLALAIWREPKALLSAMWRQPLLVALILLAFVSAAWSIDTGGTLRRAVWLTLSCAFGFYLAWRYAWAELAEIIAGGFAVLIAGSFMVSLAFPGVGVMTTEHPGAWSGLWTHKNTLGGLMALASPLAASAALVSPERRRLWASVAAFAFALVVLSTSKTALLATLLGYGALAGGMLIRRGPVWATLLIGAIGVIVVVFGGAMMLAPQSIVGALGRDLTFTGRTDIWDALRRFGSAHPWFGYGYCAFWLDPMGPAYWVREAVRWQVASAHNGWLELSLGVGRVGLALFVLHFLTTLRRAGARVLSTDAGLWAPGFLIAFAFYSVSESHILQANDLFWIIYVAVAARLALDARRS